MTRQEFGKVAMAIRTYYPKERILPDDYAIELWYDSLKDLPYEVVTGAVRKWSESNQWSPTIADIRSTCASIKNGEFKPWEDGWQEVCNAIRKYGYMREGEALHSLSDITRKIVMRMDYQYLCASENIMADRANFRDIYNNMVNKQRQREQLSPAIRSMIDKATERRYAIETQKPIELSDGKTGRDDPAIISKRAQEMIKKTREELRNYG